jgi:predicted metal-dependent phosphoesterase TrpH
MIHASKPWRVEFHCHTSISSDSSNHLPRLLQAARRQGLDRLAITDHNTIVNALRAYEMAPDLVIIGEEIKTSAGELLAYFVSRPVVKNTPPMQAVQQLKEQGAFICLAHPFDSRRGHWTEDELIPLLPFIDAVEVFNSRSFNPAANQAALQYAGTVHLPQLVGSDAHSLVELGLSTVELPPFHSAEELRSAIRKASLETQPLTTVAHIRANFSILVGRLLPGHPLKGNR